MGATYTRQSTYSDGDTITAAHTNDEFDQLVAAFAASTGHTHDGTTGEGGPITSLATNTVTFGTGADTDVSVTFDANTNDGVFTWMEDEDYFQFSDDILMSTTEKLQFRDTALYIHSSTDGQLDIIADTEVELTAPTIDLTATTAITLQSDAITFGEAGDTDIVLTFNANTADGVLTWMEDEDYFLFSDDILMNSTEKVQFGDTASFIQQSSNGVLRIDGEVTIDLNASTAVTISNDLKLDSDAAVLGFGVDNDVTLTHVADTGVLLNTASVIQFRDSAINIGSPADGDLDINADDEIELNSTLIDINGNADISGTTTLTGDVTLGGKLIMPTVTSGHILVADGTSFEEKAVGDLSEISTVASGDTFLAVDASGGGLKKITRSTIVAGLATSGAISNVVDDSTPQLGGNLDMNGADIVTTSNATLDLAPNGTGTVVVRGNTNSGAIVFNCESNSHGQTVIAQPHSASVTNTMLLPAGANSTLVSLVSTDTLTNKTLTSPVINTATVGTSIVPASADGATLGTASAEFSDLFLADAGTVQFGNDQDVTLTHVADTGLLLNAAMVVQFRDSAINIGSPADGDLDINADDEIELNSTLIDINGNVEISGTLAQVGVATFTARDVHSGGITIANAGQIGSVGDADAIAIASDGQVTLTQQLNGTAADFSGDVGGGNFQPDGDTAAGDAAAFGYTAALGAIITGQGSTNDITLVNDADATVLGIPTGTTNVDIVGVATAATFEPDGDTAAGDNAAIGYTAGEGLILTGQGSTTDVTIKNDADATVASIATGTTIFKINNDIEVDGRAFGHVTTDNDGSFDLAVGNDFQCTPSGDFTLTFTNPAAGQSGNVFLINSGGHTVSAHASVAINAASLTALTTAGTYHLAYYCSAASGNNTIAVSASGALT